MTYSSSFRDSTEEEIKFFKIPFEDAEEDSSLKSSGKFQSVDPQIHIQFTML